MFEFLWVNPIRNQPYQCWVVHVDVFSTCKKCWALYETFREVEGTISFLPIYFTTMAKVQRAELWLKASRSNSAQRYCFKASRCTSSLHVPMWMHKRNPKQVLWRRPHTNYCIFKLTVWPIHSCRQKSLLKHMETKKPLVLPHWFEVMTRTLLFRTVWCFEYVHVYALLHLPSPRPLPRR